MSNDNLKPKDIIWNTLGTCSYAIVSLVLSIVIIKLTGKVEGGIFAFGFSTLVRLVYIITFFGIRPMHIVDVNYKYYFKDYKGFGNRTAIVALLVGTIYVFFQYHSNVYTIDKFIILILLVVHGVIDGYADYYESEYQRANKLYLSGMSQFFRIILFAMTLIITLIITKNLVISILISIIAEILIFIYFNIYLSNGVFLKINKNNNYYQLLIDALPLFLVTFLDSFVFSISKLYIDTNLGDVYSGFYNIVFMPTNAIYLLMTLFMKPILTPLAKAYFEDKTLYNNILKKSLFAALFIGALSIILAMLLGKAYLSIIYYLTGNSYHEFDNISLMLLNIIIIGGTFYTLCTPMYFALIIENKRIYILISYIAVAIISTFLVRILVNKYELLGAAYGFAISMALVFLSITFAKFLSSVRQNG